MMDNIKTQWGKDTLRKIQSDPIYYCDRAKEVIKGELCSKEAIENEDWAYLVEVSINASCTFEDVTENEYGERVSHCDDEGDICQAFENYCTIPEVADLLGNEMTWSHPQWSDLAQKLYVSMQNPGWNTVNFFDEVILKRYAISKFDLIPFVELALEYDSFEFNCSLSTIKEIYENPNFWSWVEPNQNACSFHDAFFTNSDVQKHPIWFEVFEKISNNPKATNLKTNQNYNVFLNLYNEKQN